MIEEIPLARPPADPSPASDVDDIPEDEKLRLISESGLLGKWEKIQRADDSRRQVEEEDEEEERQPFVDEVFVAVMLIVPMTFLYLIMDMYVSSFARLEVGTERDEYAESFTNSTPKSLQLEIMPSGFSAGSLVSGRSLVP